MTKKTPPSLSDTLWKIYRRPERPELWSKASEFHWTDPEFSRRVLLEHLDESHAAASRVITERARQIEWLWSKLELRPGAHLLDITCGPGLYAVEFAGRDCQVTGIDFSSLSIAYANDLAVEWQVADRCAFIEQDIHHMADYDAAFDAAIFLYGQLAAFPKDEAQS
jgi:2-polyprenyl-3-methyl-5-hydroxy-6-metoxy-1,4-benzoquinol methylase